MDDKKKSLFQERLVCLYLRLNGYLQSGYIPHSAIWGNAGTDIDRIAVRFPLHSQPEREIGCSPLLELPDELATENPIDIVIAEVKNKKLSYNDTLVKTENKALENWGQLLRWIGLFEATEITNLTTQLIAVAGKNGAKNNGSVEIIQHRNSFGFITIRPILFSIEKAKNEDSTEFWINGIEILDYIWECFSPELPRIACSTTYDFKLWGFEFMDIVSYLKDRYKNDQGVPTLDEMYRKLI